MGGFDDRSGELVDGAKEDMLGKLNTIEEEMTGSPFILGADCTLPTEIAYDRIRFVVQEMRNRSRRGGQNDE